MTKPKEKKKTATQKRRALKKGPVKKQRRASPDASADVKQRNDNRVQALANRTLREDTTPSNTHTANDGEAN